MQYFFGPSTDPCGTPNDRILYYSSKNLSMSMAALLFHMNIVDVPSE
jgi:hypothetical protein